jgi:hypothetical protein
MVEKSDVHEVPAITGAGLDARSVDKNDKFRLILIYNDFGRLGRQRRNKPQQNWPKPGRHTQARTKTRNAKREAAGNGERSTRTRFRGHYVYRLRTSYSSTGHIGEGSRVQPNTQHRQTRRSEEGPGENGQDSEAFRGMSEIEGGQTNAAERRRRQTDKRTTQTPKGGISTRLRHSTSLKIEIAKYK